MPSINLLSQEISELIAAGEVIERPCSVIKELVENSIDSGARHITVEIKNGGTTYMRVTDDGCGMSFDDVPKAFLRHATSKISSKEDLDNILTLGFRGEALASVAAVSRVEVMTKQKDETYGTLYNIEGSVESFHDKGGCPDGTTIIIRELFYNVPARRKFLKKDITESNAVSQILQKITMSHPDIAFKFIRDNRVEFNSSGDEELFSAVYAVYGRDFARDLINVEYEYSGIRVTGFTVKPLYSKNNRSFQNFFVNGRYVRSKLCSAALENAYENMIMTGKFPACVMMIELPPASMDVNIHPTKAEVRFTDEKTVSDAIFFAVKNALMNDGLIYEFELKPRQDWRQQVIEPEEMQQQEFLFTPVSEIEQTEKKLFADENKISSAPEQINSVTNEVSAEKPEIPQCTGKNELPETASEHNVERKPAIEIKPEPEPEPENVEGFQYLSTKSFEEIKPEPKPQELEKKQSEWTEKPKIKVIGEAFGVYIIAETEDKKMVMIDKHAAHERIIFERLKSRNCRQYSQMLMNGIKVLLTGDEFSALEANTELLADMGFVFDFSEHPCVKATAVPTFIMELDIEEIISEIAENLRLNRHDPQSHTLDDMLHTVACKSAIRGNDKNSAAELQSLAEQVYNDERIRHCPHGRPVMFTMTKSNIEHQFGRS
ncbi:MAG: DNA mismatch repair endonuclease MutL [Ruminococcus flavefaciens]|nr:DNA mismatch repair endonuclease MutL [Ruminococcus flavefaciens]MCM1360597.1 DNA mismatch repair endonuclease MutL [Clostridiales bacterium]MCM1435219.1 DNA mismatch repair endonuclease MutL [Ruminococcus flavefaciens]